MNWQTPKLDPEINDIAKTADRRLFRVFFIKKNNLEFFEVIKKFVEGIVKNFVYYRKIKFISNNV